MVGCQIPFGLNVLSVHNPIVPVVPDVSVVFMGGPCFVHLVWDQALDVGLIPLPSDFQITCDGVARVPTMIMHGGEGVLDLVIEPVPSPPISSTIWFPLAIPGLQFATGEWVPAFGPITFP